MIEDNKFSCFVIGDSALTIQCSKIITSKGHKLIALFSNNEKVKKWAMNNDVEFYDYNKVDVQSILNNESFDYLFNIVYLNKISDSILLLPKKFSINYHDSLLPIYGGIHATSWAIMNNENNHGITWHIMSSNIDEGDILKQKQLDISPKETTSSLNFKCYTAGIHTFIELLDELSSNTYRTKKQDLNNKSYFAKYKRPLNACVINFEQSAYTIDAFARGLDFGKQINKLGVPKILIKNMCFLVPLLQTTNICSNHEPGVITKICKDFIQVSTTDYDIRLLKILDIDGKILSLSEFATSIDLRIHDKFENLNNNKIVQHTLNYMCSNASKHEDYWIQRLLECTQYKNCISKFESTEFIQKFRDVYHKFYKMEFEKSIYVMTCFLYCISIQSKKDIFYVDLIYENLKNELKNVLNVFPQYIPVKVNTSTEFSFEYTYKNILEEFRIINENKIYPLEVFYRYPNLSKNENMILIEFVNDFCNCYSEEEIKNKAIVISINIKDNLVKVLFNDDVKNKYYFIDIK